MDDEKKLTRDIPADAVFSRPSMEGVEVTKGVPEGAVLTRDVILFEDGVYKIRQVPVRNVTPRRCE